MSTSLDKPVCPDESVSPIPSLIALTHLTRIGHLSDIDAKLRMLVELAADMAVARAAMDGATGKQIIAAVGAGGGSDEAQIREIVRDGIGVVIAQQAADAKASLDEALGRYLPQKPGKETDGNQ